VFCSDCSGAVFAVSEEEEVVVVVDIMATLLSTQLQALAVGRERGVVVVGGTTTKPNTRVSILFNPAEAADIDLQTIFALAQAGK
jgi:hypothetical protein